MHLLHCRSPGSFLSVDYFWSEDASKRTKISEFTKSIRNARLKLVLNGTAGCLT